MIGHEEQIELFKLIGTELNKKTECFIIGGSAMMFYGFKSATKDIDIVFLDKDSRNRFKRTLKEIGFTEKKIITSERKSKSQKIPTVMDRKETRFDLFCEYIINFQLSLGIIGRIKEVHEFGNLIVKVVSQEDIILLKCATDRAGDRLDAKGIIEKYNINWNILIEESLWQTKHGKRIYPLFLYDFLVDLREDFKINIPKNTLVELRKISEDMLDEFEKKRNKK